jgi:hypothetical protein
MTRRESPTPTGDREALKREIQSEIRSEGRRKSARGCFGCLAAVIIVLGAPLLYGTVLLAKSGFARPPLMENMYKPVEPSRKVEPLKGTTAEQIAETLPLKASPDPVERVMKVPVGEAELTTLAMEGVTRAKPGQLPFPMRRVQFAIQKEYVELHVIAVKHGRDITMRAKFVPEIREGKLDVRVIEAQSGSLEVPLGIANFGFDFMFEQSLMVLQEGINKYGALTGVDLSQGTITFSVKPH